ncbi:MAG TPA: exonuclease domain-containing protein [Ktedonobacterales bacterium]
MRSDPVRVAVDLETTGLRPDQDAIIEIGAVKFAGMRVLDIYQSFVSLSGPLPYRIQRLTGIVPADLRRAPQLASMLPGLRVFLGDAPLVGHSVAFDAAFLRRAGVAQRNPLIDTYELASMLLPALPSYTLGAVALALGVPTSIHHRALADADLARAVFIALLDRLDGLDTRALDDLAALPAPVGWTPGPLIRAQASERKERVSASPFAALIDATTGGDTLAARGLHPALAHMAIYQEEPQSAVKPAPTSPVPSVAAPPPSRQITALREGLAEGGVVLYELERKDGAQIATLAEVVRWVASGGQRAIIATLHSDDMIRVAREMLPRAATAAGLPTPTIAELDLPSAYLSLRRWFGAGRDPRAGAFPLDVTRGLSRLTVWARETTTGLRADVALHGGEEAAWERVRAGAEFDDTVDECPYNQARLCFAARAWARAARAAITVTTHATLAASLSGAQTGLPDAERTLVIAGRLMDDALRQAQTITLDPQSLLAVLNALAAEPERDGQQHDLLRMAGALLWPEKPGRKASAPPAIPVDERAWRAAIEAARSEERAFFATLRAALRERQESSGRGGRDGRGEPRDNAALRVDADLRGSDAWARVERAWTRFAQALAEAAATARAAADALAAATDQPAYAVLGARTDLLGAARRLEGARAQGACLITRNDDAAVTWIRTPYVPFIEQRPGRPDESGDDEVEDEAQRIEELADAPSLSRIPIHVGKSLQSLWRPGRGLILAGWALSVGGDFEMTRSALSLPESARLAPVTPDYSGQTLLCLPDDVAEPNAPGAQSQLDSLIVELALALEGDVVAIFPSHAMLRSSAHGVRRALERHNILALAQGVDGSARQLWQNFDSQERVVLLAAGSFWDGGERNGRAPACVVVARTPFPAPSDPLIATRAEAWPDPQNQFMTPQAALKLRQALGGLAWSHERRNAIVLFDRRLQTRGYGPTILGALPDCAPYQGSLSALPDRVARWTRGEK